MIEHQYIF